jgi:hypothetical protein
VSDTGYNSDRDWDARSSKSYHSDGYLSDISSHRNRPPINDRTFVSANENNKNGREENGYQNGYRRPSPSRENTQDGRRSKRRTSLVNGDTSGRFMIEEEDGGNERSAEKGRGKKEVSWSDGRNKENKKKGGLENRIADSTNQSSNKAEPVVTKSEETNQNQRVAPKIVTQPSSSEATARPADENPTQEPDHENEAQTFLTDGVNSGVRKSDDKNANSSAVETRNKLGIESSFEKSEADTMISNAYSGYQGDVSDIGPDEKTDAIKKPKKTSKV